MNGSTGDMEGLKPTERFSDRVDAYVRHRPSYPPELLPHLRDRLGLDSSWRVADVGSGPGVMSRLFLEASHAVWAVEPNEAMRVAAERSLGSSPRFNSVAGRAEATGLPADSVDLVVCAQAFHWFDPDAAAREFRRIAVHPGWVVLVWNTRRVEGHPFLVAYERFLERWGVDYRRVRERYIVDDALALLYGGGWERATFANRQVLDHEGLRGRLVSSSYAPPEGHPDHGPMLEALESLFESHARDGVVVMEYDTEVYSGTMGGGAP